MNEYFLHIGLHKTGTKFFQHKVFPNLSKEEFVYNPAQLNQLICDLMKSDADDLQIVRKAIEEEKRELSLESPNKKIIISREIMAGDLFSFYKNCDDSIKRLYSVFPDAKIIYSLRYQVDWIVSCYRESVHEHHYQRIEQFLNFEKGKDKFVNNSFKDLDINRYVKLLHDYFGNSNVFNLYYEELKINKQDSVEKVAKIIGSDPIAIKKDRDKVPNRGYSAFSISLSIFRFKVFEFLGLSRVFNHRPIFFFGPKGIPAGFENLSVLPPEKYWGDYFLRDNQEIRSNNYPNLNIWESMKISLNWRNIVKKKIDKAFYWDWDLLKDHRNEMDQYFKNQNRKGILKDAPQIYL